MFCNISCFTLVASVTVDTILTSQNLTKATNHSSKQESLSNMEILSLCIYFVILVMGVIGNGLVIFVTGYKMKTTVNSVWFLNLAIADFIFILFLVREIFIVFHNNTWLFSDMMCKCMVFIKMLSIFASIFFLTVISVDRCLCTWVIVWIQNKRTLDKARIICIMVWLLSISCSIPFFILSIVIKSRQSKGLKYCRSALSNEVLMSLVTYRFIVGFLIPFLIIALSYIAIGVRVKRLKRQKQLRSFRVLFVILAFFICWFPFHVHRFCYATALKNKWSVSEIISAKRFIYWLAYLNSCLNPILYVFMCDEFKKKLKKSLLLVLEAAFTEEHLIIRSTRSSTASCSSESQSMRQTHDTTSSPSGQENRTNY